MATRESSNQKSHRTSDAITPSPLTVVGVGGLEAFEGLLQALGDQPSMAIIFVQHLDPTSKSLLPELLSHTTTMEVVEISKREKLKPNTIYICAPQTLLDAKSGGTEAQSSTFSIPLPTI